MRSLVYAACVVSLAVPAKAQEPPAAETEPAQKEAGAPAKPPDIVKLKNGGLIRGTISEIVPDDAVVIVMITGETRRVPMAEVEYAGPDKETAQAAPAPAPPTEEPPETTDGDPDGLTARLVSADVPIKFYARSDSESGSEFSELCTTPCDATLTPGNYRFALSQTDSKEPLAATQTLRLTSPATIRGEYNARAGLRAAGALTLFVGSIVGIVLWATATSEEEVCTPSSTSPGAQNCMTVELTNGEQLWAGRLVTAGSIITGLILITRSDSASVELVPGAAGGVRTPARLAAARDIGTGSSWTPAGLSVAGRF